MTKDILKTAFKDTVPVIAGYVILGMGFGIIMNANGYSILFSLSMSFFIYAGSMQYAAIGLFTGGASYITVALTTLAVNARHIFYGISMLEKYKKLGKLKPYIIFALTDETYSLVCNTKHGKNYFLLVSVFDHFYWILGTFLGGVIGSSLNFNSEGVDFALTALFVTVFVNQWMETKDHFAAVLGVSASVISLLIFGNGNFLIPSMVLIVTVLLIKMRKDRGGKNDD